MTSHRVGRTLLSLAACGLLLAMSGVRAAAPTAAAPAAMYDAVADFSVAHNPNEAWRYLAGVSLLGSVNHKDCDALGIACRWNGNPVCNSALVAASTAGAPVSFLTIRLPADHLMMDPESIASVRVRWTAPAAGSYEIQGDFLGIDTSERSHPIAILDNAKLKIYANTISSYGQQAAFDLTRKIARGETIDFVVSTGSACTYLSTGLKATVTAVTSGA